MANSISSVTTGTGGIVLESVDTSGNTNIKSGGTTIVAVTSTGAAVTGTLSASGGIAKASLPTGSVLQVVQGTYSTQTSTTSNSFVSAGVTASITPSSASSKIFVIAATTVYGSTTTDVLTTIFRGDTSTGTNVAGGTAAMSTKYNTQASEPSMVTNVFLDSPSTSSAQLYTFAIKSSVSGQLSYAQTANTMGTITLMEIAA
jgi:hypothetical protein